MDSGKTRTRSRHQQQPGATFARTQCRCSASLITTAARTPVALSDGPTTSFDLRRLRAYQNSARFFESREAGYGIGTARWSFIDHNSCEQRSCARYSLAGEPFDGGVA